MTSRSGRGRWEHVLDSRRQARAALGREPDGGDPFASPPKRKKPSLPAAHPAPVKSDSSASEYVLSLGEAAARLGITRETLEAMIVAGKVKALPTGYTRMVPTREVERLTRNNERG